jgi:NADH-quinone oxidoreductase subunit E
MTKKIQVCCGRVCGKKGGKYILSRFKRELECDDNNISKNKKYSIIESGCLGRCQEGPNIKITDQDHETFITKMSPLKVPDIIKKNK